MLTDGPSRPEADEAGPRSLLDRTIRWSITNRLLVVVAALVLAGWGALTVVRMPVDVFPDLTAPTVTVVTEAHGLAPEEVELLVTARIETAVYGAAGVRRVRSASGIGISIVWVDFDWGADPARARQIVAEKLPLAAGQLPPEVAPPLLTPMSSVMGEILFIGVRGDRHHPMAVRDAADWIVRRRLLAVAGVAQVIPIGGEVKQYQVQVDPVRLRALRVRFDEVAEALEGSSRNGTGGFLVRGAQETLIRAVGRAGSEQALADTVIRVEGGVPVYVRQVADVRIAPAPARGAAAIGGEPAVVLAITKQPGANTLALTEALDRALDGIAGDLPDGMVIERGLLRQADFIEAAVDNVSIALRDGAILVALVLALFLLDVRTTVISLVSLPLSLLLAILVLDARGASINTMTLGGLTIAVGALVDDAIIDVENVFRRLRLERALPEAARRPAFEVVYQASREIRTSIVFATLIVMIVFVPLLLLGGVEGRLLAPLGEAYLVAIFASLVVALTATPALCALLLPRARSLGRGDSAVVRGLQTAYRPVLRAALAHPIAVTAVSVALLAGAVALIPGLGRTFLPDFNEGALTINVMTLPGTSLAESDRLGAQVERRLLEVPEVVSTARRTGRGELDEHAQEVSSSEIDVRLRPGRGRAAVLADVRRRLGEVSGAAITIGQPISHRIDHMLSGTRAAIAVKVFGDDLAELRGLAERIRAVMAGVPGVVDLSIEQQVDLPELRILVDRDRAGRLGLTGGAAAEAVEGVLAGRRVAQVLEGQRAYDVVVRYGDAARADRAALERLPIDTPLGVPVPLDAFAAIRREAGPSLISRENVQRKIVVMANVAGRDIGRVVDEIQAAVAGAVPLPDGYHVAYGGQFESGESARRSLGLLGVVVIAGILGLLYLALRSLGNALLVMVNLPLALIGGIVAVRATGGVVSVASLVGFITLFGIATRNGIMMVTHIEHLRRREGASLDEAVERGARERLSPIVMTALTAGLALVPLVLAGDRPGNEIQAPLGIVILGGLATSTLLNLVVVPVLYRWAHRPRTPPAEEASGAPG
jgi:CzcA family heavy metal efflux pump